jgi:phenylacetate-coenzyme A ligase PaaK-like adenylate-forming protein
LGRREDSLRIILQDRKSLAIFFAAMCSRGNPAGKPGIVEAIRRLIEPLRVAIVTIRPGFYPSGSAIEFMPEIVGGFVKIKRLASEQADLIEQLNAFQPNVIVSYASVLEALSIRAAELHLKGLRQIANISEQLTARARRRVREAFGIPLPDHYATGECLLLTNGCPTHGGSHVNSDWAVLEIVDERYRPVPPGQLGKRILVTHLANTVQPFIRYEVGDQLSLAVERCACGSRLPRIGCIEGRVAEVFWTNDGKRNVLVSAAVLASAIDALSDVREWQAIQTDRNVIRLRAELMPNAGLTAENFAPAIRERLAHSGMPDHVELRIEVVPELKPDKVTNKFRRMISEIGPPGDMEIQKRDDAWPRNGPT